VAKYFETFADVTSMTDAEVEAIFADASCPDLATPCMHADRSCVQKTINSDSSVAADNHCYLDLTAADQSYWKFGTWDKEGKESHAKGTFEAVGNTDCYCPTGTVDTTPKLLQEQQAVDEVAKELKDEFTAIEDGIQNGQIDATIKPSLLKKKWFFYNQEVVVYDTPCADGKEPKDGRKKPFGIAPQSGHMLCGQHFLNADGTPSGSGSCAHKSRSSTCVNDRVQCVKVGAFTTAELYKHCQCPTCKGNKLYTKLDNSKKSEATYFNIDASFHDTSRIVTKGSGVISILTSVMGSACDCMKKAASAAVATCQADSSCASLLTSLETCMEKKDGSLTNCLSKEAPTSNLPFAALVNAFANTPCVKGNVEAAAKALMGGRRLAIAGSLSVPVVASASGNTGGSAFSVTASASAPATQGGNSISSLTTNAAPAASGGVSGGAAAGIAVGCVAAVGLVVAGVVLKRRQQGKSAHNDDDGKPMNAADDQNTDIL